MKCRLGIVFIAAMLPLAGLAKVRSLVVISPPPPALVAESDEPSDITPDFPADVYPSLKSAVNGLVNQAGGYIATIAAEVKDIRLYGFLGEGQLHDAGQRLAAKLPDSHYAIEQSDDESTPGADELRVAFRLLDDDRQPRSAGKIKNSEGVVQMTLRGAHLQRVFTARFQDKPWVENFDAFVNEHPSRNLLLAHSDHTCADDGEANHAARRDAIEQLALRVAGESVGTHYAGSWLRNRLETALESDRLIVDRFAQRYDRPYGSIWYRALLIEVPPQRIEHYRAEYRSYDHHRHMTVWREWAAVGGLMVFLFLLYLFLNTVTKDYFRWRLRAAAMLVVAVVVLFLAMMGRT